MPSNQPSVRGYGDYNVSSNSCIKGQNAPIQFSHEPGVLRLKQRELVTTIVADGSPFQIIEPILINPGNPKFAQWLSKLANGNFQQYQLESCVFDLVPVVSPTLPCGPDGSTQGTLGSVYIGTNPNSNEAPWDSKRQWLESQGNSVNRISDFISHAVQCAPSHMLQTTMSVRGPVNAPGTLSGNPSLENVGLFQVAVEGYPYAGNTLYQIFVTYSVSLLRPQYQGSAYTHQDVHVSLIPSSYSDPVTGELINYGLCPIMPFGADPAIVFDSIGGCQLVSAPTVNPGYINRNGKPVYNALLVPPGALPIGTIFLLTYNSQSANGAPSKNIFVNLNVGPVQPDGDVTRIPQPLEIFDDYMSTQNISGTTVVPGRSDSQSIMVTVPLEVVSEDGFIVYATCPISGDPFFTFNSSPPMSLSQPPSNAYDLTDGWVGSGNTAFGDVFLHVLNPALPKTQPPGLVLLSAGIMPPVESREARRHRALNRVTVQLGHKELACRAAALKCLLSRPGYQLVARG